MRVRGGLSRAKDGDLRGASAHLPNGQFRVLRLREEQKRDQRFELGKGGSNVEIQSHLSLVVNYIICSFSFFKNQQLYFNKEFQQLLF